MSRFLIVAHDTGGAEMVSAWVANHSEHTYKFCLEGPAVRVFQARIGAITVESRAALDRISDFDFVLTGTGWASDLEKVAIQKARAQNIPVASYLNHWVSYRERFLLEGELILPNEIWVGDIHAFDLAKRTFPNHSIKIEKNFHFEQLVEEVAKESIAEHAQTTRGRILFLSEPILETENTLNGGAKYFGYTEFEALSGFLDYAESAALKIESFRLRQHPIEAQGKYASILKNYEDRFQIEVSSGNSLAQDCAWADTIVGCDTMAMVLGVLTKRRVLSCIPKSGRPLSLPYPEIERIF